VINQLMGDDDGGEKGVVVVLVEYEILGSE